MSDTSEHKGYYTGDIHNQYIEEHYDPKNRGVIWRTFWILLVITVFEVGIAFTSISKSILMIVFIALTIVKAYFIVAFFMHLKHEKPSFGYSIILPFLLIVYLIAMCITEGSYIGTWGLK
ncbi:MAG: cytochrome C oxidase subunit IV family protein [Bacteroidota bacterium]